MNFPKTATCVCGRASELKPQDVKTIYKEQYITVENVPVYPCEAYHQHIKLPRKVRAQIRKRLKLAYKRGYAFILYEADDLGNYKEEK